MLKVLFVAVLIFFGATSMLAQETVTVFISKAVLRGTPAANGEVVTTVKLHETLEVITRRGGWYLVQTPKHVGWINVSAIRLENGGEGIGMGTGRGTPQGAGMGPGYSNGTGTLSDPKPLEPDTPHVITDVKLISKPRPLYTTVARDHQIQGTVTLRVTFLASGQIGSISPIRGLPDGLTEQAVAAARLIKFEPKKVDGVPRTVTKSLEFTFVLY